MFWVSLAHAASVAVLDFDTQGQTFSTAQLAAEALRDTLLSERLLDPLSARDIAEAVSAGKDETLRLGRQKVSEARRLRSDGDLRGCATRAGEAGDLLLEAGSDVGRRTEVADVYYLQGSCLFGLGDGTEAAFAFEEVTRLYPGYLTDRAAGLEPGMVEALARAQAAVDALGPRRRPAERLARLEELLGVDYVVTGNLDRKGRLTVSLHEEGRLLGEAQAALRLPVAADDPAWSTLAHVLVDASGVGPPGPAPAPREVLREDPPPAAAAPRPAATARREEEDEDGGPVGRRWWVWTTAALLAGGGATAVVLLTGDPPPEPVQGPPTWSVHIPTD